jgi:hypothetical protein
MNKNKKFDYRKVMITLTPEQGEFLDRFCSEVRTLKGSSLSRTEIIRALVDYFATLKLNLKGIKDEVDLLDRIKKALK